MRAAAALIGLAACGSVASPQTPGGGAEDRWRALAPSGADWERKVAHIPPEDREAMALALLGEGNFQCEARAVQDQCGREVRVIPEPTAADGIDAPCLRRKLALWALDQVDGATLESRAHRPALDLVRLPPPETELNARAFEKLAPHLPAATRVWAIQQIERVREDLADAAVADLPTPRLWALACHGIDGAMLALIAHGLDESTMPDRCGGLRDLRSATRAELVRHASPSLRRRPDVLAAIRGDCAVMDAAGWPPRLSRTAWHEAACARLLHGEDLRDLIAPTLRVRTEAGVASVLNAASFQMPFADELLAALPDCRSDDLCRLPGTGTVFWLTYDADHRLTEIHRDPCR